MIALLRAVESGAPFSLAPEGAGSFALDGTWPDEALHANGYLRFGRRAVRADLAERLGWEISKRRKDAGKNVFAIPIDLASMVSCPADDWPAVLKGFGLAPAEKDKETQAVLTWRYAARARPDERPVQAGSKSHGDRPKHKCQKQPPRGPSGGGASRAAEARKADPNNPFAALTALLPPEKAKPVRKRKPKAEKVKQKQADTFVYKPFE